jgi:hypothetical protein
VLALTDEALVHLCIAAGRVPARMRGRWLRQLAQQLEPPPHVHAADGYNITISNGARRMRAHRSRQAAGRVTLRVDIDFNATSGALFAAGFLSETEIDDAAAVARAVERVIALLPVRLNGDA